MNAIHLGLEALGLLAAIWFAMWAVGGLIAWVKYKLTGGKR